MTDGNLILKLLVRWKQYIHVYIYSLYVRKNKSTKTNKEKDLIYKREENKSLDKYTHPVENKLYAMIKLRTYFDLVCFYEQKHFKQTGNITL